MDYVRRDRTIRKVSKVKRDKKRKTRRKNRERGGRQRKRIKEIRIREREGYYLFILLFFRVGSIREGRGSIRIFMIVSVVTGALK